MRAVANAYGRAVLSQLHLRMLVLSAMPLVLSLLLWGLLLYFGLQPLLDWLHTNFVDYEIFRTTSDWLERLHLGFLKSVVVPFFALLLLLPLMILSALLFMNIAAMPFIVRHVGGRHYPKLEQKQGGSMLGGLRAALSSFAVFIVIWLATLPLYIVPPLAMISSTLLWGWLTSRVMSYDALADHASEEERRTIQRERRRDLLVMGLVSGAMGSLPPLLMAAGAVLFVALLPLALAVMMWLYVLIFIFTALWFQYYCLEALAQLRAREQAVIVEQA
ncbi:EI24 domain-containing protein [[Empedobacter] haloabium]|uniref:EI24 domain-containing protein n=1 Tax=[Empedobacter] haloabium TaxID=592317 RepID=A0ABZ1UP35_9BURK